MWFLAVAGAQLGGASALACLVSDSSGCSVGRGRVVCDAVCKHGRCLTLSFVARCEYGWLSAGVFVCYVLMRCVTEASALLAGVVIIWFRGV